MTAEIIFAFTVSSVILALAPGPDNIFVLTQSAVYGVRKGLIIICGLCTGVLLQTFCAALGLSAFITAVPSLMTALQLVGVAYLVYLSISAIRNASHVSGTDAEDTEKSSGGRMYLRGFIMNITNPKVQLFFLSFFPQFLPKNISGSDLVYDTFVLGLIFTLSTAMVFGLIAVFAGSLTDQFRSPAFNRILNFSAAGIFLLLAAYTLFYALY